MAIDAPKSSTAAHRSAATSSLKPIAADTRFKPDFQSWLKTHGYGDYDFAKNPNALPSFGGKSSSKEKLTKQPVILIHGNAGIAAGNEGVLSCDLLGNPNPTSSTVNGFSQRSQFLKDLNADPTREGDHVYSIWSMADPILGYGPLGGIYTGPIPHEDGEEILYT